MQLPPGSHAARGVLAMGRGVGQQRQRHTTTPVPGVDFVAAVLRGKFLCAAAGPCARPGCGTCQGVTSINE